MPRLVAVAALLWLQLARPAVAQDSSLRQLLQSGNTSAPAACTAALRRNILWGAGTGSYQVEGAAHKDGRTDSVWDVYLRQPGRVPGGATGEVAADFYHRWRDDVALMKRLGIKGFRFSLSWSRLLPGGGAGSAVNPQAVAFYGGLMEALQAAGITPLVALYQWDMPQSLQAAYGGFTSPRSVDDFGHFADTAFRLLGDRVRLWLTVIEPWVVCSMQYGDGSYAPGINYGDAGRYACGHNVLLAHAKAAAIYRTKYRARQQGRLSFSTLVTWPQPASGSAADARAAQNKLDADVGWFLDPIFKGDYPASLRARKALPRFTAAQMAALNGSLDYIASATFTATYVTAVPGNLNGWRESKSRNGVPIGLPTGISWILVAPWAQEKSLLYLAKTYRGVDQLVSSSGTMTPGEGRGGAAVLAEGRAIPPVLADAARVDFYRQYLGAACLAAAQGARLIGWFAWSFMDSFEWTAGYGAKFGVVHVDYAPGGGLARTPKASALWLSRHFFQAGAAGSSAPGQA